MREVFVRLYEAGTDLSRQVHRELVPGLRHRDLRPRGQARRGTRASYTRFATRWWARTNSLRWRPRVPRPCWATRRWRSMRKTSATRICTARRSLLPLMNREIPIILDELANPEFGTGAVKVTPAHDPNDFQAGLRHNLPQIDVMDETRAHEPERRSLCRPRPLRGTQARAWPISKREGFLVAIKDYTISLGQMRSLGHDRRAAPVRAVVREDRSRLPSARSKWWRRVTSASRPTTTRRFT